MSKTVSFSVSRRGARSSWIFATLETDGSVPDNDVQAEAEMPNQTSTDIIAGVSVRRVAAIAFVDIVGSSILMGEDEAGTLDRWMRLLGAVIRPQAERCHGRIVKSTGDGVLVEFPTALDAIEWAREVQRAAQQSAMAEADLSRAILLRIALNVGNIVVTNEDIYGASVNLAARLQEHAEPGGIVLTQAVHEQIEDAIGLPIRDLGMLYLKASISRCGPTRSHRRCASPPHSPVRVPRICRRLR